LFRSFFEFAIARPPVVRQPRSTCWAAALESVLKSTWRGRPALRVEDLVSRYRPFLQPSGDISVAGFEQVAIDLRFGGKNLRAQDVRLEKILSLLREFRVHLLLVHDLTVVAAHTEVVYGVRVQAGVPQLLIMDPFPGDYTAEELPALHEHGRFVFLLAPGRPDPGLF
jgi:hypothetical protein